MSKINQINGKPVFTAEQVFEAMTHQPITDFIENDLDNFLCGSVDEDVKSKTELVEDLQYLLLTWGKVR